MSVNLSVWSRLQYETSVMSVGLSNTSERWLINSPWQFHQVIMLRAQGFICGASMTQLDGMKELNISFAQASS